MSNQAAQHRGEAGGGRAACAACGSEARRDAARYCSTCGRALGQDYFPTESLRASYRFARPSAVKESGGASAGTPRVAHVSGAGAGRERRAAEAPRRRPAGGLTRPADSGAAGSTALAFATYALVPYVGILFCPGALVAGGIGLLRSYRTPQAGGRRSSAAALALALVILCVQLLLWWILYKVPEWSGSSGL
ncbi:MAG TPA: hypothetical protein VEY09_02850 [Pyrinomonadaceae bacterium]|nr:hypothetical protein [Pyrinomonadaceae bacterium]